MTGPAAQGVRVEWAQVPAAVRAAIEEVCGAAVVRARTQPGGFSPGLPTIRAFQAALATITRHWLTERL